MNIQERVPLAGYTTFRIGGAARWFVEPTTMEELARCLDWARQRSVRALLLGGGSNLLVADDGVEALVVRPSMYEKVTTEEDGPDILVTARGPMNLARLLGMAMKKGWAGLEDWAAIPGTVGGAIAGNAGGARGLAELAETVEILDADGATRIFRKGDAGWMPSYRDGGLGGAWVLRATFRLRLDDPAEVRERIANMAKGKAAKQPIGEASAGCVFRNPPEGPPAGKLLDEAGLKGERIGGAAVSDKHANFIVNAGGATSADVIALMDVMWRRVRERSGVELRPEIRRWK